MLTHAHQSTNTIFSTPFPQDVPVTYTQDIQAKKYLFFSSEKWKFLIIFTLAPPFLRIIGAISWKFPLPVSDDWFVTALPITGNWTRNPDSIFPNKQFVILQWTWKKETNHKGKFAIDISIALIQSC